MRNRWLLLLTALGLVITAVLPLVLESRPVQSAGEGTEIRTGAMLGGSYNPRWFYIRTNGGAWTPTHAGTALEGRLMNFRAANAIFDDDDDPSFDAQANTEEFISNFDAYKEHGIIAFTVSLQGGNPDYLGAHASAFRPDGSLRDDWMARAAQVIEAADARGQIVILTYFYFRQDHILENADAIRQGVRNATDWLITNNYRNVIIEIANEHNHNSYGHAIIKNNKTDGGIGELITIAKSRFEGIGWRPPVSASRTDFAFKDGLRATADVALPHGNGTTDWNGEDTYASMKSIYDANAIPVVMNEDHNGTSPGTTLLERDTEAMDDAIRAGGSWGLMWSKYNQHMPFEWDLGDPTQITTEAGYFHAILDEFQIRAFGDAPPPPTTPTATATKPSPGIYDLVYSLAPDRADAAPLDGATVSGSIYVLTKPDTGGVVNVTFHLNGSYVTTENSAPFDFQGGSTSVANQWETTTVADGTHNIEAIIMLEDGSSVIAQATFTVANSAPASTPTPTLTPTATPTPTMTTTKPPTTDYGLVFSLSPYRDNPIRLDGASVRDNIYVFTAPNTAEIEEINFYLNGEFVREEENAPYDFASGTIAIARAWDTAKVADGQHTIEAVLLLVDGSSVTAAATFTVANTSGNPTPTPAETPTPTPSPTPSPTPHDDIYGLVYSQSANRDNPLDLAAATVSGKIYVFSSPVTTDIEEVSFYLDGNYVSEEENAPYDFISGTIKYARPWDTTTVDDGQHTIEAILLLIDGSTTRTSATFTVANDTAGP